MGVLTWIEAVLIAAAVAAPDPVALHVSPRVALEPATITVRVRVIPIETDRHVILVVDGPNYHRESAWELDRPVRPRTYDGIVYRGLPAGDYLVLAAVGPAGDVRAVVQASVLVR